jgi:hypothetical protein
MLHPVAEDFQSVDDPVWAPLPLLSAAGPKKPWRKKGSETQGGDAPMIPNKLTRTTFATSRLLDFCSEKELRQQTGHPKCEWPLVIIIIILKQGIPPETVDKMLDYTVRVSSREAYVSPTRGAQGNALKTLAAMPFVLDGHTGRFTAAARGVFHDITFRVDQIRQEPVIDHVRKDVDQQKGTRIGVYWPADQDAELPSKILVAARARFSKWRSITPSSTPT